MPTRMRSRSLLRFSVGMCSAGSSPRAGNQSSLDDDPAVVARERGEEAEQVDVAGPELAERAAAPGRVPVARVGDHGARDILDVNAPHAPAPVVQRPPRHPAIASSTTGAAGTFGSTPTVCSNAP